MTLVVGIDDQNGCRLTAVLGRAGSRAPTATPMTPRRVIETGAAIGSLSPGP